MVILGNTRVKDALDKYPELKDVLISLSPKFKKLNNKFIFKTVARWATFQDVAKIGGISICELLHRLNREIGMEEELLKYAPECIKEPKPIRPSPEKPQWLKKAKEIIVHDVRHREDFFFVEIIRAIRQLDKGQVLKIVNDFYPAPLINMLKEQGYEIHYENPSFHEHILFVNYREPEVKDWLSRRDEFEEIDVENLKDDYTSAILKKANETPLGHGFVVIQQPPIEPLLNLVAPLGYDFYVEKTENGKIRVYFYRKQKEVHVSKDKRIPLVIQSATPLVYPVIMRLLNSKRLMEMIKIEELKVWDKTEKHLGWIVNKKADISFSAVGASLRIFHKGLDVKMKAIVVWDNFFLLTYGFRAKSFDDLKGKKIHLPLIKAAPPYLVTVSLLKRLGYNPDEFEFVFGTPFGRPMEIKEKLVKGEIEAALLREPEASMAIFEGDGKVIESIKYADIWRKLFKNSGRLPNAGILFKGEILRNYPEIADVFLEETRKAIEWVKEYPEEAAELCHDAMHLSKEEAEFFIKRANFLYKDSEDVIDELLHYVKILQEVGYGNRPLGEYRDLFI